MDENLASGKETLDIFGYLVSDVVSLDKGNVTVELEVELDETLGSAGG